MDSQTNINILRKKEGRGILLIILIIITAMYNIISFPNGVAFFLQFLNSKYLIPSNFSYILQAFWLVLSIVLKIIVLIGIWYWKKKAVFLGLLIVSIDIVQTIILYFGVLQPSSLQEFIFSPLTYSAASTLGMLFLWAWVIKRKWHLFT